jgi:cell division septal protein FtsQ
MSLPFEKRKSIVRLKFLLWSGVFTLLAASLIGASYFVLYSDFFKVKGFEVSESRFTPEDKLLAALDTQMIARSRLLSVLGPDNILFWSFGKKPEKLENLPLLARVSVDTDLTDGKVIISTEERYFSGIWCASVGCYAFDKEGIIFAKAPEAEGTLILKVYDENDRPFVLGTPALVRAEWRENVFKILEVMESRGLVISRVNIKNFQLEEWEVETAKGPVFQFSLNSVPLNLERILDNLDDKFEFEKTTYFDFRVENRIYYK